MCQGNSFVYFLGHKPYDLYRVYIFEVFTPIDVLRHLLIHIYVLTYFYVLWITFLQMYVHVYVCAYFYVCAIFQYNT